MANGVYALAEPYGEGGTFSLNQNVDIKTEENTDLKGLMIELFDRFLDEPVYGGYEEHKEEIAIGWGIAALFVVGALAAAAFVVTGGIAGPLIVAGSAAIVGGVSAGINYGTQKVSGDGKVDWCQVAIAGFGGAISGAVAASPLGVEGQIVVNGIISGAQSYTQGGSTADILASTGAGCLAGWLGGSGPEWKNTNIFVPEHINLPYGVTKCCTNMERVCLTFRNVWKGVPHYNNYIIPEFSGLLGGFIKGTATSNAVTNITGYTKKVWDKYRPQYLKDRDIANSGAIIDDIKNFTESSSPQSMPLAE